MHDSIMAIYLLALIACIAHFIKDCQEDHWYTEDFNKRMEDAFQKFSSSR